MAGTAPGGPEKWTNGVEAAAAFVADVVFEKIKLGVEFSTDELVNAYAGTDVEKLQLRELLVGKDGRSGFLNILATAPGNILRINPGPAFTAAGRLRSLDLADSAVKDKLIAEIKDKALGRAVTPAASPLVSPAPAAPAAPAAEPFMPDDKVLDAAQPLPRETPFDPSEALRDAAFMAWLKENEAAIGLSAADLAGSDAAKLKKAAEFFDAYTARPEVADEISHFIGEELKNLGGDIKRSIISEENFGASIEEYLAKNLLENPKRILRIKDLLDEQAELEETAAELTAEAKKKIKELEHTTTGAVDMTALAEEELLLRELEKVGAGEYADRGTKIFGKIVEGLEKVNNALHFFDSGYKAEKAKITGSKHLVGGLVRSKKEAAVVSDYEKFLDNKGRGTQEISADYVARRIAEITELKEKGARIEADVETIKNEIATKENELASAKGKVSGALRIAEIARASTGAAIAAHLTELIAEVGSATTGVKIAKVTEALNVVKSIQPKFAGNHVAALADAERALGDAFTDSIGKVIEKIQQGIEKPTADQVIRSFSVPLAFLVAKQFKFGATTREEYRSFLVSSLNRAADALLKDKKGDLARLVRTIALDVKTVAPGDKAFRKRIGLPEEESSSGAAAKPKKTKADTHHA